jgi:pimeloyl-ACP methyl ester carboxylesterase
VRDREGYAVAIDGAPIFYEVFGSGAAGAVALCDGIGCDGFIWKYLKPALIEAGYRVVHLHYRGHGRTPPPRDRRHLGIVDLADDVASVLDAVEVERAGLLGHSMGVQVCFEVWRRHHDRVNALGLLCGAYGTPLRTFHGKATLEAALPWVSFLVGRTPRVTGAILKRVLPTRLAYDVATRIELNPDLVHIEDFMPYLEHLADLDPTLFLGMLAQAGRHTARELLPEIDVPTLIVAGESDGWTPPALSHEMHEKIPGSQMLVVEGGSHTAPIERPDLVTHAVLELLARANASK